MSPAGVPQQWGKLSPYIYEVREILNDEAIPQNLLHDKLFLKNVRTLKNYKKAMGKSCLSTVPAIINTYWAVSSNSPSLYQYAGAAMTALSLGMILFTAKRLHDETKRLQAIYQSKVR